MKVANPKRKLTVYLINTKKEKDFKTTHSFHNVERIEAFRIINDLFSDFKVKKIFLGSEQIK